MKRIKTQTNHGFFLIHFSKVVNGKRLAFEMMRLSFFVKTMNGGTALKSQASSGVQ
jgi:hypothetical protein